jgi:2-polyprenyl-3-methyl-5-hydroxy-6-metoxy-1,4-benzoquinol methylase
MDPNQNYFNQNSKFYGNQKFLVTDNFFLKFIRRVDQKGQKKFLDIGGGSGVFSQTLSENFGDIKISIVDPSEKMLEMVKDKKIIKYRGYLPNSLNIPTSEKFDFILLKEVLHHVTGTTIDSSRTKVIESLKTITDILDSNGVVFIHELYYESYIWPTFSRTMIFWLLKIQDTINIRFLPEEFRSGLSVCFYTRDELKLILSQAEFQLIDSYEENFSNTMKKKCLFLKNWGRILLIIKKSSAS